MKSAKDIAKEFCRCLIGSYMSVPWGAIGFMTSQLEGLITDIQIDALEEAAKIAAKFPHDGYIDHVTAFNVKWQIENVIRAKAKEIQEK